MAQWLQNMMHTASTKKAHEIDCNPPQKMWERESWREIAKTTIKWREPWNQMKSEAAATHPERGNITGVRLYNLTGSELSCTSIASSLVSS